MTTTPPRHAPRHAPSRTVAYHAVPARFQRGAQRNAKIARTLRVLTGTRRTDTQLLDALGQRFMERDELGGALARAMRSSAPDGERVNASMLRAALTGGDQADTRPAALAAFMAAVNAEPEWLDRAQVEAGAAVLRRTAHTLDDVLTTLSLVGGFRFGGPPDLLERTGTWGADYIAKRVNETRAWVRSLMQPGGLEPGGEGWRTTLHVRVMHAVVNDKFERNSGWDQDQWGKPINQSDLAGTLGLFNSTSLLGMRSLGYLFTPAESRAVMHLWRYVGWLIGVDEDWLHESERQQNIFNVHVLLAQDGQSAAGGALANALIDAQAELDGGLLAQWRGRMRRARLLSLLRWFIGRDGLADLQLPRAAIWAVPPALGRNVIESVVIARTSAGRRWLEALGQRHIDNRLAASTRSAARTVCAIGEHH